MSIKNKENTHHTSNNNTFYSTIKKIGAYEIVSKTGFFITLGLCYKYRPGKLFMKTQVGKNMTGFYYRASNNIKINYQKIEKQFPMITNFNKLKSNIFVSKIKQIFYKIPETFKLKSKKFTRATGEALVIYHLMIPIYIAIAVKFA